MNKIRKINGRFFDGLSKFVNVYLYHNNCTFAESGIRKFSVAYKFVPTKCEFPETNEKELEIEESCSIEHTGIERKSFEISQLHNEIANLKTALKNQSSTCDANYNKLLKKWWNEDFVNLAEINKLNQRSDELKMKIGKISQESEELMKIIEILKDKRSSERWYVGVLLGSSVFYIILTHLKPDLILKR